MPRFDTDRWQLLSPYLDQALEIPTAERAAWLDTLRRKEPELVEELQTLLAEHGALDAAGFLEERVPRPPSLAGQTVGPYTLESALGRGGMGSVWSARRSDGRFEGKVAIKFLNFSLLGKEGEERFKREGSFLAKVAHPHIAHLIDAGVSDRGQPFLVLEYVEGEDIESYCRTRALGTEERIRLFLDVLTAVAHAHANLIVHRDIKPSNVMVTLQGNVKLLDFGIAKLLEDDTRDTGQAMTLAHAAPEQLTSAPITTGTDVYALGVLLYLLLSGKHPAEGALRSQAELIESIVNREPAPPSTAATDARAKRALRGDLDTLVLKALKKNPGQRYPSAAALAEDLQHFLHHQPITARPDRWSYRVGKFLRRNRTAVALSAAAAAAAVAGVAGTLIQARTARAERDFAVTQLARAEGINDLDDFVLSDAAPSGEVVSMKELIARAEKAVTHRQADDVMKAELLVAVGRL
ncbi:MAG TPA: serine/threonine-protein kinase, partial [Myxococcaceae bacterium]|nr:serine/threonine-protein kinase [Myxococcaceae bacterium]